MVVNVANVADPFQLFQKLLSAYGPQQWWPAESPFEVMVGAILTQNTAWERVEAAIANLRQQALLDPQRMVELEQSQLAEVIRPSGYFNLKAKRLQAYCTWYLQHAQKLEEIEMEALREALLEVHGVGPETADDILLYALDRPVFVVDAYTRRIFQRVGWLEGEESYLQVQLMVEQSFAGLSSLQQVDAFKEFHGLMVEHAKRHCRKRPTCEGCPLACGFVAEKEGA